MISRNREYYVETVLYVPCEKFTKYLQAGESMIAAYEGNLPYIFVSYAHKDSREVFELIEKLSARGYRIWYDEGIEPGSEWPENIANHLLHADMVLAMITNDSMESINCRREINFALSKNKPFLAVVLEKTKIPAGIELQLSSQQSVLRYNFNDEERFLKKIESCSYMAPCKDTTGAIGSGQSNAQNSGYAVSDRKLPDMRIIAALGIALAALLIFFAVTRKAGTNEPTGNTGPAVTTADSIATADSTADSGTAKTDYSGLLGTDSSSDAHTDSASNADTDSNAASNPSVESPTEAPEKPDERWIYSVSKTDESLIYTFRSGPVIVMPISWNNKITVMEENKRFVFYHASSRNSWHVAGYEHGGQLFSLCYSTSQDYKDLPDYSELGRTAEEYYYLMFPTDVQGYMDNERIFNEFNEMWQELDYVKSNSSFSLN